MSKINSSQQRELKIYQRIKSGEIPFEDLGRVRMRGYIFWKFHNACAECGLSEWRGQVLSLEIDHKDGNHQNNREENLVLLCPNCHSLTPTHRNQKRSRNLKVSDSQLVEAYRAAKTTTQALLSVGLSNSVGNRKRLLTLIENDVSLREIFLNTDTITLPGNNRITRKAVY